MEAPRVADRGPRGVVVGAASATFLSSFCSCSSAGIDVTRSVGFEFFFSRKILKVWKRGKFWRMSKTGKKSSLLLDVFLHLLFIMRCRYFIFRMRLNFPRLRARRKESGMDRF